MRDYKRKSDRKPVTSEMLAEAQEKIASGMSKRKVAEHFGIDESTLRKRLKKGTGVSALGRFKCILNQEQEMELAQHCNLLSDMFYGLTLSSLRSLAFKYVQLNKINHPFSNETQMAGVDWAINFLKRNNLSLRLPQKTSVARIMGFNRVKCDLFFNNLTELQGKYKFSPTQIYNMDETGITTVPNKAPKIVTTKGKRAVGKVSSAERGQLVTAVCCMNAAGNYVPPALIFPRKREKEELMNGAPPGSVMFISDSGYINCELFVKWLRHFQNHVGATKNKPVLLILDNHTSHITLENVQYCRENSIHLLSLPPHSSHKMQPLDRCYFKSLKDFYGTYCDQWMMSNPGRVITQFQVAQLFGKAYLKNSTAEKAVKAFEVCGIVPMDRLKFGEEDFLPSEVTDQKFISPSASCDDIGSHNEQQPPQPSTSGVSKASKTDVQERECSPCGSSENREGTQYSPSEIIPVPKVEFKRKRMGKGKKSTVLTSTPHKTALEMERNSKVNVANRKLTFKTGTKEKKEKSKKPESSEKQFVLGATWIMRILPQKTG
ncbi:hypothetical protein ANN_18567 [Periplaneta americana]|uniref:Transposase n=1 Tax=Periplaneta americana TaxID=6978 RepID=A0ABQ8SP41_PERAM|nr:hypothetical protein ANN_18567 [Periplaneta americana]